MESPRDGHPWNWIKEIANQIKFLIGPRERDVDFFVALAT